MDINSLLSTNASAGRVVLAAKVAFTHCEPGVEAPFYFEALERAIKDEPPPFDTAAYAELYLTSSESPTWMAVSLITNAEREGDGAKRLWSLAACSDEQETQRLLKRHALDESRHALFYLALLDITFPGATAPSFRRELNSLSPHFSATQPLVAIEGSPYAKKPTIDDFIQMNIAELRTAIHHIMQRPAIAMHCPEDKRKPIVSIQDSLLRDELKHVAYTGVLIDQLAKNMPPDRVHDLFRKRFHLFNMITMNELGEGVFDCSVACCARHSTCRAKAHVPANDLVVAN
jgi:hypothetical protein